MPVPGITSFDIVGQILRIGKRKRLKKKGGDTYNIVTIRSPFDQPIFFASLTHANRLQALLDPKKRPSFRTRCLDMATASASDILNTSEEEPLNRIS